MPQMAPLNWLTLYFYFIILFIFYCIFNYYMFLYLPSKTSLKKEKKLYNWKW